MASGDGQAPDIVSLNTVLLQSSDAISSSLNTHGVRQGHMTALMLDCRHSQIVAMLGAIKSGSTFVALEPSWPDDRLRYLLEHSATAAIIVQVGPIHTPPPHHLARRGAAQHGTYVAAEVRVTRDEQLRWHCDRDGGQ